MVGPGALRLRLAEVVEEGAEPHLEPVTGVGRRLDDLEDVLVEREVLPVARLLVPHDSGELRQQRLEHARLPRKPQRPGRLAAEQELRQLPHPVRRQAPADPFRRHERDPGGVLAHLRARRVVRLEAEL